MIEKIKPVLEQLSIYGQLITNILFFIIVFYFLTKLFQLIFFNKERIYVFEIDSNLLFKKPIYGKVYKSIIFGYIGIHHFNCTLDDHMRIIRKTLINQNKLKER
jgi:hypothetical protein